MFIFLHPDIGCFHFTMCNRDPVAQEAEKFIIWVRERFACPFSVIRMAGSFFLPIDDIFNDSLCYTFTYELVHSFLEPCLTLPLHPHRWLGLTIHRHGGNEEDAGPWVLETARFSFANSQLPLTYHQSCRGRWHAAAGGHVSQGTVGRQTHHYWSNPAIRDPGLPKTLPYQTAHRCWPAPKQSTGGSPGHCSPLYAWETCTRFSTDHTMAWWATWDQFSKGLFF